DVYVWNLEINSDDEIFAGLGDDWGFKGIAYSSDHGDTWEYLNEGLGGEEVLGGAGGIRDIEITYDGYVYLATDGGVYRSVKSTTGIENNERLIIENYKLLQNHPNPFNNETIIGYALKEMNNVNISIYNSNGQFVQSLVNEQQRKGKHSILFNANKLNSGIYYYRLKVDGVVKDTKKMLYLR
ncbi:MAG: T9SS type A sorting domain-containing protein, partial [Candidatus Delongbacteria bacterium]|nr:T9SS type A sorting domain-containing protein [Candidatus Delongbacteria bacterium]